MGAFDAAWMMKRFAANVDPLELLREREAIYLLLPNITIAKNHAAYTIDPSTRYPASVLKGLVPRVDIASLYDKETEDVKKEQEVLVKKSTPAQVVSMTVPSQDSTPDDDCEGCHSMNHSNVSTDNSSHHPQ